MNLKFQLKTNCTPDEARELTDYIKEHNIPGLMVKQEEGAEIENAMGGVEMTSLVTILSSAAVAAGVKGLFDVLKNYFALRQQKDIKQGDVEIAKIAAQKITISVTKANGEKIDASFSSFDDKERERFMDILPKPIQ